MTTCARPTESDVRPVLLFAGDGTSVNDVAAIETILKDRHLEYSVATSQQLNVMNDSQVMAHRLLIVPGGNFIAMSESLTPVTTARIRNAVHGGLNYLGICAGAFLAADGRYRSFDLTSGVRFGFYAAERRGIRKAAVAITGVDGVPVEHYWEDGPELSGWGAIVGKYPDGTPAVVEGRSERGWVILSGVHPEAPDAWRRGLKFTTSSRVANAYAGILVDAALHQTMLPRFQ